MGDESAFFGIFRDNNQWNKEVEVIELNRDLAFYFYFFSIMCFFLSLFFAGYHKYDWIFLTLITFGFCTGIISIVILEGSKDLLTG